MRDWGDDVSRAREKGVGRTGGRLRGSCGLMRRGRG
jgi:hypothetical protein